MGVHVCRHGRKLRIQFPGASYLVINRGNDRRDHYSRPGEAKTFILPAASSGAVRDTTTSGLVAGATPYDHPRR